MTIQIINDDCFNVLPNLEDNFFNLILTDPPYGNLIHEDWDKIGDYYEFSRKWILETKRVLHETGNIYIWCSIGNKSSSLLDIARVLKDELVFQDMIVWNKQRGRGNRIGWLFTREEILWATKLEKGYTWNREFQYSSVKYHESWIKRLGKENNPYKRTTNVWSDIEEVTIEMARETGGRGRRVLLHPAQKPLNALKRIILVSTKENDWVLDPFGGSGQTALACQQLNRNCIIIEKNENYCKIIEDQINPQFKQLCLEAPARQDSSESRALGPQ